MKNFVAIKFSRILIACLFLLVVIINFENAAVFQLKSNDIWWMIYLWGIGLVFFILNLATSFGLFFDKRWCFWLAYPAIVFSTIFFSTSYIPLIGGIYRIFPENIRYILLLIANFIVLAFIAYLHVVSKPSSSTSI